MRKRIVYSFLIVVLTFLSVSTESQEKYSKLKKEGLDKLIKSSYLIVESKVQEIANVSVRDISLKVKVLSVLKGPRPLRKLTIYSDKKIGVKYGVSYIFFLKKSGNKFFVVNHPKSILKSDIFLLERTDKGEKKEKKKAIRDIYLIEHIKKEVMKWRIESSEDVTLAQVESIEEKNIGNKKKIFKAVCSNICAFKGNLKKEEKFVVEYIRDTSKNPPPIFIFSGIPHVLFLKKSKSGYTLINDYDGAFLERKSVLEEIKILTKLQNPFDNLAGQPVNGIVAFCPASQSLYKVKNDIMIHLLIRNVSKKKIEIYNEEIQYFVLFHIFKADGVEIPIKYPRKTSIPPIRKNLFLTLNNGDYFYNSFNVSKFCQLPVGKYTIYLEFNLPWEYSGKTIGKSGWIGKVISNKLEITIED